MFKDSVIAEFPEMSCFGYLFRLLQRIGGCTAGFSGPIPITVSDVKSWCDAIGVELFPTEIELIASLSGIYCAGLNRYKDPENHPPRAIADDGSPNFGYLGVMQQEMRKMR